MLVFAQTVTNMHFTCKIPCNTCGVAFHIRGWPFHTRGILHTWNMELHTCIILLAITHVSTYYHKLLKHQALSFDEPSDEPS